MRKVVLIGLLVLLAGPVSSAERASAGTSGGGTQRWAASYHYGGPAFSYAVGVSPDGSTVFSTGSTVAGSGKPSDAATLAYDASTGMRKWVATYSSSGNIKQGDRATRLAVSGDGSKVFVTGDSSCWSCSGSYFHGWSTVAYEADTGTQLWAARYATDGGAYSIAVSPDGSKVFVNGQRTGGLASAMIAYDAATGEQLWVIERAESPVYWDSLAVSPDSSTVFVAAAGPHYDEEYNVAAYDASNGTKRWSAHDSGWMATALGLSPDGSTVFVTGYNPSRCCASASTIAYDASTGTKIWVATDDQITGAPGDGQVLLAVSPDGSKVFVTGYDCRGSCTEHPFVTVAHDASTGNRLWVSRYKSGGNTPIDLAVSPDGASVFVTGQETMPCYSPCTTAQVNAPLVAYDASTGDQLWVANYENNLGWALAVSPDGSNVYLAGTFTAAAAASSATAAREDGRSRSLSSAARCSAGACGYSTAAYNTRPGPGMSQERDPSLTYNGWRSFFHKTALGAAYRASRIKGDTATYRTPKTTSVVWLTHRGPDQGKARVRIDGRVRRTVDLYSPTVAARSVTFKGLPRTAHTIEVEVLGTKNAASTGRWVAVDGFKVRGNITVESSFKIRYDRWRGKSRRAASAGAYRESGSRAATVSFTFTGRSITWVTATGPAYGRARVVIDGVRHVVDLYRRTQRWRTKIPFTGLSPGTHHIKIRPLGRKHASSASTNVVFDAFVVRS